MAISDNQAAWITALHANPFKVGPGPQPDPAEFEVVIKVNYAAVNPTDYKSQDAPYVDFKYPVIFGTDVAGTIVQLGSKVTQFRIGQRVIGHCDSLRTQKVPNAGFQRYSTCREVLVSEVPDSLPLANAAVLPLSVTTASSGLFIQLELPLPTSNPKPTGKTILIWGGSSSCGSSAIQLAVAAGIKVATTAGKSNTQYVKSLGASEVFDHKDPQVADKILEYLKPGDVILDCIGSNETQTTCGEILSKIGGGKLPILLWPTAKFPDNVEGVLVNGLQPGFDRNDIGAAVWRKYLPEALAAGKFQAKPDPYILGGGLDSVQKGVNLLRDGVSAKKIVIEIAKE